jgi:phi13 family phage major tail protein
LQFVIDKLSSKDSTDSSPINLAINSLIVRRSCLKYDEWDAPKKSTTINPKHLDINNISAHILLRSLTPEDLSFTVKRLAFMEQSGLTLSRMSFHLERHRENIKLDNFFLQLPRSSLSIQELTGTADFDHIGETLNYSCPVIEASITPENADPDIQYADDIEFDVLYPDPELTFTTKMADIPLAIQEQIFGNQIDDNGVLIRSSTDKPPYFAVGFKSEKSNHKFRYVWLYKVRAKPLTENYATKEGTTITRQTGDVEWTAIKRTNDGRYQAVADEGENGFTAEKGETFLQSVYTPVITPPSP